MLKANVAEQRIKRLRAERLEHQLLNGVSVFYIADLTLLAKTKLSLGGKKESDLVLKTQLVKL